MSECQCITQEVHVWVHKPKTKWYQGWVWAPLGIASTYITIHAKDIDELMLKRKEVKAGYERKYPGMIVEVWA